MAMSLHRFGRPLAAAIGIACALALTACGGGGGGSAAAPAAPVQAAPTAPAAAPTASTYAQGYTLSRVGWYSYDATHSTTPLIANVQTSLNDSGQVAGYYTIQACATCAYTFATNGTPTYSDTDDYCMGHDGRMACTSDDTATNSTGVAAGYQLMGYPSYDPYSGTPTYHAFAAGTDLGTLGGANSYATGLNTSGQAAGYSDMPSGSASQAFIYDNGAMRGLGTLGGTQSQAMAINARGQVTGNSTVAGAAAAHAFLYFNGAMADLGEGQGNAINNAGQVAGTAATGAFLTGPDGGAHTNLGGGTAVGVNDAGQVVINGAGAFLWDGAAQVNLNSLVAPGDPLRASITLTSAIAINASGQILVNGHDGDGWQLQFLLSPPPVANQLMVLQAMVKTYAGGGTLPGLVAQAQVANAAGDSAGTCAALGAVATAIALQGGHVLEPVAASRMTVDVHVLMSTVGCTY